MAGVEVAKMKEDTYYVSFPEVFVASAGVHVSQEGFESSVYLLGLCSDCTTNWL